jgi:Mce-associated membrane protein
MDNTPPAALAEPASADDAPPTRTRERFVAGDDLTADPTPTAAPTPPSGSMRWLERGVAAALLTLATTSAVFFYQRNDNARSVLASRQSARAAACSYAPTLANYTAKNLDSYFNAVLAGATGDWKKQFTDTSRDLRDILAQGQVVSEAGDVQCALKSGNGSSAEVNVVIGQSLASLGTRGRPQRGQLSMVLSMTKSGSHWLVDKVDTPPAQ